MPEDPTGYTKAPNALIADPELSDREFRVLMAALWLGADESAQGCWAAVESIGRRAGEKCETSTRKTLQSLVDRRYLESHPDPSKLTRRTLRAVGKSHLDPRERDPRPAGSRTPSSARPTPPKPAPRGSRTHTPTLREPAPDQEREHSSLSSVGSPSAAAPGAPTPGSPAETPAPPPRPAARPEPADPREAMAAEVAGLLGRQATPDVLGRLAPRLASLPARYGEAMIRRAATEVAAERRDRGEPAPDWSAVRLRLDAIERQAANEEQARTTREAAEVAASRKRTEEERRLANQALAAARGITLTPRFGRRPESPEPAPELQEVP